MNKLIALVVIASVALIACGASSTPVRGPDGANDWFSITCRRNQGNCIEEAGEVCPHGYVVASTESREGLYADRNVIVPAYNGEMLIKCR